MKWQAEARLCIPHSVGPRQSIVYATGMTALRLSMLLGAIAAALSSFCEGSMSAVRQEYHRAAVAAASKFTPSGLQLWLNPAPAHLRAAALSVYLCEQPCTGVTHGFQGQLCNRR